MSLRESRILNSLEPWLRERVKWLGEVATIIGSNQSLLSGRRSSAEQRELYNSRGSRPVAFPGCSQHQYGFAADAAWQPAFQVTSKGRARVFSAQATNNSMESAARYVGLVLVAGDTGHMQVYPGSEFRVWAQSRGLCNPNPPPSAVDLRLQLEAEQDRRDDSRLFFKPVATFGSNFFRRGAF